MPSRRRGNNRTAEAAEHRRWLDSQRFQMALDVYADYPRQESRESRARPSVHYVKQTGSIRDYVDRFNEALYHESEMSDKDEVKAFLKGLKRWSTNEFVRLNRPDDVFEAQQLAVYCEEVPPGPNSARVFNERFRDGIYPNVNPPPPYSPILGRAPASRQSCC